MLGGGARKCPEFSIRGLGLRGIRTDPHEFLRAVEIAGVEVHLEAVSRDGVTALSWAGKTSRCDMSKTGCMYAVVEAFCAIRFVGISVTDLVQRT